MRKLKTLVAGGMLFLVMGMLVSGCGDDGEGEAPAATLPALAPGWNVIRPGGDTICSRGTEFSFAVHPGTVNKLVIDFMGGGACWNQLTCSVAGSIFNEEVNLDDLMNREPQGIYDRDNPENPFKDWYHVFIPYCTGDIHWGDNVVTYGEGDQQFTIHHKGGVNALAVRDWVFANFGNPETILVTGCSAGAYGSIGATPFVMDHYRHSKIYQLGDSGAGVVTDSFFHDSFPAWNALANAPSFIPGLDPARVDLLTKDLSYFYEQVGNYFPDQTVGQYNTAFDENQTFYYTAMGGQGGQPEWSRRMFMKIDAADQAAPNFYSFTAPGQKHCIIPYDEFYTYESGGVRLRDWIEALVNGQIVSDVTCGSECGAPSP